ncbi:MAG: CPBP family intramembrane glutamic endopeptidase [Phycisphaeraceae bacterium]
MPSDSPDDLPLWILPLGAVVVALVVWSGWWRPAQLAAGPKRPNTLEPWDLLVAVGLMMAGGLVTGVLAQRMASGAEPASLTTMAYAGWVVLGQVLAQGSGVAYFLWRAAGEWKALGVWPRRWGRETGLAGVTLVVALPVVFSAMTVAMCVSQRLGLPVPETGHQLLTVLREADSWMGVVLLLGSAVVVAPVLEELLYRGLLQSVLLWQLGVERRVWVIVGASVLFALMHAASVPWQALPGLFVLSLALGWLYERTGSLWPCVAAHAGFNAVNVGLVLVAG